MRRADQAETRASGGAEPPNMRCAFASFAWPSHVLGYQSVRYVSANRGRIPTLTKNTLLNKLILYKKSIRLFIRSSLQLNHSVTSGPNLPSINT